jgi:hypothetical protein
MYHIKPPTFVGFLKFLKRKNLKYTHYVSRRHCAKCNVGQLAGKLVEFSDTKLAQMTVDGEQGSAAFKELKKNRDTYQDQLIEYTSHLEHMDTARVFAYDCRDSMKVGDVFVTRDYVNHYDHSGAHVKCLHWVLQWREVEGGSLELLKIRHYCSDKSMKTNHGFTIDCMNFMFHTKSVSHPGLFDNFLTVYFAGDHGGHFAHAGTSPPLLQLSLLFGFHYFLNVCVDEMLVHILPRPLTPATMIEESRAKRLYGKEVSSSSASSSSSSSSASSSTSRSDVSTSLPTMATDGLTRQDPKTSGRP